MSLSNESFKDERRSLWIAVIAVVVVYLLWNIPAFDPLLYPLRLFVTYVHEAGHSIMALITGGQVIQFSISSDGSGLATTAGGIRALILPAGYLGAAFFGAALFYFTHTLRYPRVISIMLGIGLIIFSVLFARPDRSGLPLALIIGGLFGIALIAVGWKLNRALNIFILNVLAIITSLNAVMDLLLLINNANHSAGMIRNDAAAFSAEIFPLPAVVWAILWAGLAILLLGAAVYYSIIRRIRRSQ